LIDAAFVPQDSGRPLLIALHSADSYLLRKPEGKERVVMTYKWNGIGFTGIKEIAGTDGCDGISFNKSDVYLLEEGAIKGLVNYN
jgi:hypothetical protein